MKSILPLFVFIDACGWEIIKDDPFARSLAPNRRRLTSVFGYSSACVPSILSGAWPDEHRNWCYFVHDPRNSPFRFLRPLRFLPRAITSRRIFRRYLSKLVKTRLNFRGYFDLYNIPFRYISMFDFSEKKSPLQPGGMNRGENIFDFLEKHEVPYHVSDPAQGENRNLQSLLTEIKRESIDFAFVYWPELDGLLHRVGNKSLEVPFKLRVYEQRMERLMAVAREHYAQVRLYIFSDHGMANCTQYLDLQAQINTLGLRMGEDFAVVYDSTMARFWFFNDTARQKVIDKLEQIPQGRIVGDEELRKLRTHFEDGYFGHLFFLVQEGVLIVPSHMGERPICAMHGYHPNDKQSYAALLTNQKEIPADIQAIPDIYRLMTRDAELAHAANSEAEHEPHALEFPEEEMDMAL
jgi:hypothetical protein